MLSTVAVAQASKPDRAERIAWLEAHALPLRSVRFADEDLADLDGLGQAIGDARLVLLGEQSHGDGTTFLAKARIVRYLHEQRGFDVVAFESGLYDCDKAWTHILDGKDPISAFREGVFEIWSKSAEVEPLIAYLAAQRLGKHPLVLAGFDPQPTGSASITSWVADLNAYLSTQRIPPPPSLTAAVPSLQSLLANAYYQHPATRDEQRLILTALDDVAKVLASRTDRDGAFWQQLVRSLRAHAAHVFARSQDRSISAVNNARDAQMAASLLWLLDKRFPGQKIVVWAATMHTLRRPSSLDVRYATLRNMGQIVWEALGAQAFHIGFVASTGSFSGRRFGSPKALPVPTEGSLEDLLAATKRDLAIVDFRHLPSSGAWLRQPLTASPLGYSPMTADWTGALDAMVWTRAMQPSSRSTK